MKSVVTCTSKNQILSNYQSSTLYMDNVHFKKMNTVLFYSPSLPNFFLNNAYGNARVIPSKIKRVYSKWMN